MANPPAPALNEIPPTPPVEKRPNEDEEELQFGQVWESAGQTSSSEQNVRPGMGRRTSSIQFNTAGAEDTIRRHSMALPSRQSISRRISSPPPPPTYHRGVSFDTFDNKNADVESFTLQYKHTDYKSTARSRTFLCGTDAKDHSDYALEFMIDDLVDDGDEIICLRAIEKDSKLASDGSISRGKHRAEAHKLLDMVARKNTEDKAISVVLELAVGDVRDIIQRMIRLYEPSALVVGTRGRNLGGMQGLLPGSVSKYCLQHSPVPVIVVRPSSKRNKKKQKRMQESGRSLYSSMLNQATSSGRLSIYDNGVLGSAPAASATKEEAEAVAKAIGPARSILRNHAPGPVSNVEDDGDATSFALPIGYLSTESAPRADLAMLNPIIAALEEKEDTPSRSRPRSPAHPSAGSAANIDPSSVVADDLAFSDTEGDQLGEPTIIDHRRPSTREQVPWLANILRQPERPPSRGRSRSRNRSTSRER